MFNDIFNQKEVIITGNSGFKGSWLSLWLKNIGAKVHGISYHPPSDPNMFEALKIENKIDSFHQLDIAENYFEVNKIVSNINPDFVFHLAAQPLVSISYKDPLYTIKTNVLGTANILNSVKDLNKKVTSVIITSDKCYDNLELKRGYNEEDLLGGKDVYSGSKGAAELIIKSFYHSYFKNHKHDDYITTYGNDNINPLMQEYIDRYYDFSLYHKNIDEIVNDEWYSKSIKNSWSSKDTASFACKKVCGIC